MKKNLLFLMSMLFLMSSSLLAQAPADWVTPNNMQYAMNVVAQLNYNALPAPESGNMVAAFVNGQVRGAASPDANGKLTLTIASNAVSGETITLKAYIASVDAEYSIQITTSAADGGNALDPDTLAFAAQAVLGTYDDPYIFDAAATTYDITITTVLDDPFAAGTTNPVGSIDDVIEGSDTTIVISPSEGSHIVSVYIDNGVDPKVNVYDENLLNEDGSFTYIFTDVQSNWTITDTIAINRHSLKFYAGTNGKVKGPSTTPIVDYDYITLDSLTYDTIIYDIVPYGVAFGVVEAVADGGYEFTSWSDGITTAARPGLPLVDGGVTEDIEVTASFAPSGWSPDESYQFTMMVIGKLFIEGTASTNSGDLVGAFINDVCHGVASPDENGLVFLSIGSNNATSDTVELRIWTSETGTCNASHTLTFLSNDQIGELNDPHVIECEISKSYTILAGYTWFSANIETNTGDNPRDPDNYFLGAWFEPDYTTADTPTINDRIIGQTQFAVYAETSSGPPAVHEWVGSLTSINASKMYRLFMQDTLYLKLTGSAVANSSITMNAGYTWLGYIPREDLLIATALTNFSGLVAGDRIISQNKFAIYNGTGWQGSLLTMSPGKGYIVQMANGGILNYPDGGPAKSAAVTPENVVSPAGFEVPANMKNTMMLIGQLDKASFSDKDVVYAFINGECRGMAATSADGNIYLSIGENSDEAQEVSFKVWVDAKGELANIDQKVIFEPLKAVGDLNNPFTFKMSEAGTTDSWMVGKAYPNPFNEQTIIPLWLKESAQVTVNVYNNMGQLVKTVAQSAAKSGVSNIILQKENLDKGVYYYTVNINSSSATVLETGKLIIQ